MASVYKLEPDAAIGFTDPDDFSSHVVNFDHKGLYKTDNTTEQMFLDGLVADEAHPLKLAPRET